MKFALVVSSFALCLSFSVFADTVDESGVTTFEDGTPAVADEVNANFQALIDAINDNAARITALESSSGGGGSSTTTDNNSVSGHTYKLMHIGVSNRSNSTNHYASTANLSQQHTIIFDANGTLTLSGTESEAELGLHVSVNTDGETVLENPLTAQSNGSPVSLSGTWSQSGSTITTSLGITLAVSLDGNVMVATDFTFETESDGTKHSETAFLVGVKTN